MSDAAKIADMPETFNHTPGPWSYHGGWSDCVISSEGRVAECRNENLPSTRCKGNARLIAMAPDMLAAIQGALRIADLWQPNDEQYREHIEEARALHQMLESFKRIVQLSR